MIRTPPQFRCTIYFDEAPSEGQLRECLRSVFRIGSNVEFASSRETHIFLPPNVTVETVRRLAQHLHWSVKRFGIRCSVGAATSHTVARAAARSKPFAVTIVEPGQESRFLGRLSIESIPAFGRHTQQVFRDMGIQRVSQLQKISEGHLTRVFGPSGRTLSLLANGMDVRKQKTAPVYHYAPRTIRGIVNNAKHFLLRSSVKAVTPDGQPGSLSPSYLK